ncbi:hypothetical protein [Streptomyces sp. SID161]|uniref:hypothetical protein n=1 Tax=Streptomyces sp. SID161 TaxID=2690251 RepID=UPI001370B00A|nr:hypothetical protein [Streptomyces sp. SID161]MYW48841.1 hypothetical protein [Streptomyces sp. SID161]MYW49874.1 hypothetical protein [Streptomyces sp. SID161]
MKRRKHHQRESTRNERSWRVRYVFEPGPGPDLGRRIADFHTSDKAQALRKAREYAQRGRLVTLSRHTGAGHWQDMPVTTPNSRKETTTP